MSAHNTYTMVLAFTPSLRRILLLHKPPDHRNPIFRDRWTVPGGLLEDSESTADGAAREFREETGLHIEASQLTPIGLFFCNCDPQESEHDIAVHAVILSDDFLAQAQGLPGEPVEVFSWLPLNRVWQLRPLYELAVGRLLQPSGAIADTQAGKGDACTEWPDERKPAAQPLKPK